jgi:hypothetical protein
LAGLLQEMLRPNWTQRKGRKIRLKLIDKREQGTSYSRTKRKQSIKKV